MTYYLFSFIRLYLLSCDKQKICFGVTLEQYDFRLNPHNKYNRIRLVLAPRNTTILHSEGHLPLIAF